ncbi:hypothetical protein Tco_0390574 [Tanacetum coccineum]
MDFLIYSSIHFTLTVSPIISTSFVKQFWTSAKSRIVNNISYIDAIVAGKPMTISEASIRRDLLFDNADGIEPSESPTNSPPTHPSKDQPESQPDLSPRPSSSIPILDSNPKGSGGNHEGQSSSDRSLSGNEDGLTLQSQKKKDMKNTKKRWSVSKQERKAVKSSKDEGKTDSKVEEPKTSSKTKELHLSGDTLVVEDKGSVEKGGSTKGIDLQQSTVKPDEGTDKQNESTDSFVEGTAEIKDQVLGESDTPTAPTMTSTPTLTVFGDDETIAQVLVTMSQNKVKQKEKEKGVELKNVKDIKRPRPTSIRSVLTLKPLPKIDPKAKAKKKFKMLANDEEMAKKVQEEWEAEEEKKRLTEEEATKAAFTNKYDFIQARLNADKILAEKLQDEEREKFTIKERAKLLYDTIDVQRRFLA